MEIKVLLGGKDASAIHSTGSTRLGTLLLFMWLV